MRDDAVAAIVAAHRPFSRVPGSRLLPAAGSRRCMRYAVCGPQARRRGARRRATCGACCGAVACAARARVRAPRPRPSASAPACGVACCVLCAVCCGVRYVCVRVCVLPALGAFGAQPSASRVVVCRAWAAYIIPISGPARAASVSLYVYRWPSDTSDLSRGAGRGETSASGYHRVLARPPPARSRRLNAAPLAPGLYST